MKRVTITVDEGWWKSVRIKALGLGVTTSGYIMGMRYGGDPVIEKSEKANKSLKSDKSEKADEVVRSEKESPRERMKRLHPNDVCMGCRNYNKDCTCGIT